MAIVVNIDVMMARRKMSLNELSEKVDITPAKLLQKSEMRKDIVIELSYKGFG